MVSWSYTQRVTELLTHELWHIISRNLRSKNPQIRDNIYSCIGFKPLGTTLELPPELTKISNPDAPLLEHYCEVYFPDVKPSVCLIPVVYSAVPQFEPSHGKTFFQYMVVNLLVLKKLSDGTWIPERKGKKLDLRQINDMPQHFWDQVGKNTQYLVHPEETIADNFKLLILVPFHEYLQKIHNPEILVKMQAFLQ